MPHFLLNRRRALALIGLAPLSSAAAGATHPVATRRDPVRVLWTRVNGEQYYDARAIIETLDVGDAVQLRREPTNAYDRRAIEVLNGNGDKLGYIARIDNSAVARMMDAGERFSCARQPDRQGGDGHPAGSRLAAGRIMRGATETGRATPPRVHLRVCDRPAFALWGHLPKPLRREICGRQASACRYHR